MASSAPISHILSQLTATLDWLASQNLISQADLQLIKSKLPNPAFALTAPGSSYQGTPLDGGFARLSVGAGPGAGGVGQARALWDYHGLQTPYSQSPYYKPPYQQQHDSTAPPDQKTDPPPPQAPPTQAAAPPPIPPKKGKLGGKLGGIMATSFAGGIGFGAGSAIAHDAINAIF
ncbi:hypothetical protein P7C70_g1566, partial [Phenoliferia sp. Uapishka_3]